MLSHFERVPWVFGLERFGEPEREVLAHLLRGGLPSELVDSPGADGPAIASRLLDSPMVKPFFATDRANAGAQRGAHLGGTHLQWGVPTR